MRTLTKLSALALLAASAMACGGDGGTNVEQRECGPGTVLVDGQCEVDESNCGEGAVLNADGQCEATDAICGDNTVYDTALGRCVPTQGIQCAEGTIEVDGQCLPENTIECDEGTVVANNQCVPAEDICGEGTEADGQDRCRPAEEACGEGTTFDVATRTCVPTSQLSCGAGTITIDGVCRLRSAVVDELAAQGTLDLDAEAGAPLELVAGEQVIFTGNIDAPEVVDGEYVQDLDNLSITGTAGQWIRVAIHANGMPEPGFVFMEEVEAPADSEVEEPVLPFSRTSDAGAGLDFSREIVIPADGTYALNVGPIAQLLELAGPAGGEDWGYVGTIELIDAPAPTAIELAADGINGDVRHLTENFYAVSNAQLDDPYITFTNFEADAQAEVQIWSDAQTLVEALPVTGTSLSFNAPSEEFFILVDRVTSSGPATRYSATFEQGQELEAETSFSQEVSLSAGQYVRVTQWNDAGESLPASISAGEEALASTSSLALRTANSGTRGLYYLANESITATVDIENDTTETIVSVFNVSVIDALAIGDVEEDFDVDRELVLTPGQRDYAKVNYLSEGYRLISTDADVELTLFGADGSEVLSGSGTLAGQLPAGEYVLLLEANSELASYSLTGDFFNTTVVSETSTPNLSIPDRITEFVSSTIAIDSCLTVLDVSIDVEITHTYRGDLYVNLIAPSGEEYALHDRTGSGTDNIYGNYPGDFNPADSLTPLVGSSGNGNWKLAVADGGSGDTGTLDSWTLNLVCAQ
ncbi:proprotein convertase P-domain-containing protein [Lujinxingia litoralis]|nr:proprotein convertase P-domain-containing protein [Lujinxingia litoralis]